MIFSISMDKERFQGVISPILFKNRVLFDLCRVIPTLWICKLLTINLLFKFRVIDTLKCTWKVEWGEIYSKICSPYMVTWYMLLKSYREEYFKYLSIDIIINCIGDIKPSKYSNKCTKRLKHKRPIHYECKGCGRREIWDTRYKRCSICHNNDQRYCSHVCYFSEHSCVKRSDIRTYAYGKECILVVYPYGVSTLLYLPTINSGIYD